MLAEMKVTRTRDMRQRMNRFFSIRIRRARALKILKSDLPPRIVGKSAPFAA